MIRMIQSKAAEHAKAYFSDALSKSDYYISDQEMLGLWEGKLAARLGLSGDMTKEAFFDLCDNLDPETRRQLTPRNVEERTVGYDINFHCPKSVSILHAVSGDDHIMKAFMAAVSETMRDIEADAMARVRKNGRYEDRATRELAWGHFVHQTARPVGDIAPDPHLHSHCFVFNATWDDEEKIYKAGQFREIKRDMPYYQARFHKRLADKMIGLGYQVRRAGKYFEIEGVPQKVIDAFSKRTDEIGRIAKEKGITDAKELDKLGAISRSKKQKGLTMQELTSLWLDQMRGLGLEKAETEKPLRYLPQKEILALQPRQCVDYAVQHCFERASVMAERRLLAVAFQQGLGRAEVSLEDIAKAFSGDKRIVRVQDGLQMVCTTKEVLTEEKRMVDLARQGVGKIRPLYVTGPEHDLVGQQAMAVNNILTTTNRVSIVMGKAGTGKTTTLKALTPWVEAAGKEIIAVAPSASASRQNLRNEGFPEANTVAMLLVDKKMQDSLQNNILLVDEAGMIGTSDMLALLDIATRKNAQVVLVGDTRQHAPVVRGDALRILNTVAKITPSEVSRIFRQEREDYRHAVEDLSKGHVATAFEKLDNLGFIKAVDSSNLCEPLVDDYIEAVRAGKTALVICPTHAQGDAITDEIRQRLRAEKLIGKKETLLNRFKNLNLTEAEKTDWRNYRIGNVVQFNQNTPGFMRGSVWTVEAVNATAVMVKYESGTLKALPMDKTKRFDLFAVDDIGLSKGDKIRVTHGSFDLNNKRLENGQVLIVDAAPKNGDIRFRNEKDNTSYVLPRTFGHWAHAVCNTSHAAQGKTVQEAFIFQPAATFPATDAKQLYVSFSRAKERTRLYTDNKVELLEHAKEIGDRRSALEMVLGIEKERKLQNEKRKTAIQPKIKEREHEPDREL